MCRRQTPHRKHTLAHRISFCCGHFMELCWEDAESEEQPLLNSPAAAWTLSGPFRTHQPVDEPTLPCPNSYFAVCLLSYSMCSQDTGGKDFSFLQAAWSCSTGQGWQSFSRAALPMTFTHGHCLCCCFIGNLPLVITVYDRCSTQQAIKREILSSCVSPSSNSAINEKQPMVPAVLSTPN